MAEAVGSAAGGHPNLNLTPEEKRVYGQWFREADPDGFGAVSGDVAVRFFEKTRLAPDVLGQIWQIADTENRGLLTPSGFGVVLRLIGHAQAGRNPVASLATQPAPLPRFEGMPFPSAPMSAQSTGTPSSPTQSSTPPVRVPALSPEKVAEYSALFEKSGAENGMLSGLVAKQIFERAKLSNEVLGRIWGLADIQGRGSLDVTEFVIAMHLLASSKSGAMRGVPITLPPGLYDAAARRPPPRIGGPIRPGSANGPLYAQGTGFAQPPQSPVARFQAGSPLAVQGTGDWVVNAADKFRFDQIFATIDTKGLGFITGEQAVDFFGNARLPEDTLAQIWDLSDINSQGRLDRDEFAVAMYLIRQQRGSTDGRGVLPSSLPQNLVPPSKRKQPIQPSQPTAPAFENAPVTQPRSAAEDLFGLDVLAPMQPAAPQVAQMTGDNDAGPFASSRSPPVGSSAPKVAQGTLFKPFEPSSSFGRSLGPSAPTAKANIPESEDLLGDADQAVSSKLTSETAELGNLSNQVGSLSKQMTELQGSRAQAEQELSQTSHQKRAFESRLAQLRTAYEKEVQEVRALQEQLTTARNDTKRLQQDMAMIEGSHADLSTQHQQLRAALEADQHENAGLKEKIRLLNVENEQVKPQIEKLKLDARQQKGLVAINKKQLATNELERDRLRADVAAAAKEAEDAARELQETARQLELSKAELEKAREVPIPQPATITSPPRVASPAASVSSNPFMRRTADAVFSPPMGSPEPTHDSRNTFDNIFGPSFGAAAATAPPVSFRSETPTGTQPKSSGTSTPQVVEPPAPPPVRQITSDELPLRVPMERQASTTSSVHVIPPNSRLSPAGTPGVLTPGASTPSADASRSVDDPFAVAAADEEQESMRQAVGAFTPAAEIPGAFPTAATPRSVTPLSKDGSSAQAAGAAAGIAAVGLGAAAAVAVTSQGKNHAQEESSADTTTAPSAKASHGFDEYFGGPAHQRTPSEQVKDFDDAFASMSTSDKGGPAPKPRQEFPDIQELDDDDSSSDEEAPLGFDDDFNTKASSSVPASVPREGLSSVAIGKQPEDLSTPAATLLARPQFQTTRSAASSLPGIEQQSSPPTYTDSVPNDNSSHFPLEYKGLLPEREDPTSPPLAGGSSMPVHSPPAGAPPAYGPEVAKSQDDALGKVASQAAAGPNASGAGFDFDSVFANIGPAQAEEEDSDDNDTTFGTSRAPGSEFDPTFTSPAQSRATTIASIGQSPSTYHSVTNGVGSTNTTTTTTATAAAPPTTNGNNDNFFGFNDSVTSKEVPRANTASPVSHDWDALFAPLDSTTNSGAPGPSSAVPTTTISSEASAGLVVDETTPTATTAPGELKVGRPQPGRALSTGTEHDDPILKRLTAMGWSRADSLAALEKFDYNIDKAADYLTFKS